MRAALEFPNGIRVTAKTWEKMDEFLSLFNVNFNEIDRIEKQKRDEEKRKRMERMKESLLS